VLCLTEAAQLRPAQHLQLESTPENEHKQKQKQYLRYRQAKAYFL
jgi:hypothetical protein